MADLEKVIYSIERCICHVPDACRDCGYDAGQPYNACVESLLKDALELLKAQEPIKPIIKQEMDDICSCIDNVAYCGKCGAQIGRLKENYCSNCGRAVKWDD